MSPLVILRSWSLAFWAAAAATPFGEVAMIPSTMLSWGEEAMPVVATMLALVKALAALTLTGAEERGGMMASDWAIRTMGAGAAEKEMAEEDISTDAPRCLRMSAPRMTLEDRPSTTKNGHLTLQ